MLTENMKSQVATAITDAHVAATGAPPQFVHVLFTPLPQGGAYRAGAADTTMSMITGTIRTGRTVEVKQQLIKTVAQAWSQITGQPPARLVVAITGNRAGGSHGVRRISPHAWKRNRMALYQPRCPATGLTASDANDSHGA
jgi:phenylpyruvate tautomerase PptA (4-oxalocrotonate tautomerase family)